MVSEEIRMKNEKRKIVRLLQTYYDYNSVEFNKWIEKSKDEEFERIYIDIAGKNELSWNKDEIKVMCEEECCSDVGNIILNNKVLQILIKCRYKAKEQYIDFKECLEEIKK